MENQPTPDPPDLSDPRLDQRQIYLQIVQTLLACLPPPLDLGADKREAQMRRIKVASAQVSAMLPVNAEEADLAAHAVAAGAHASDCLRQAVLHETDLKLAAKLRSQAASMGREARGYRSLLLRVQAVRQKREAHDAARGSAAMTEYCVAGLMMDALETLQPARTPDGEEAVGEPEALAGKQGLASDADAYALHYPRRARLIRRLGGLPEPCDFGPPEPALVRAIVTGDGPNLRKLDEWRDAAD